MYRGTDFEYLVRADYDKKIKINGERTAVYSPRRFRSRYAQNTVPIIGETDKNSGRKHLRNVGKVKLAGKWFDMTSTDSHAGVFFKKAGIFEVNGGYFVVFLKRRLFPILLAVLLLSGGIFGGICVLRNHMENPLEINGRNEDPAVDPNIKPIENDILTISGTVTKDSRGIENAVLSLQYGTTEVAAATTDKDGKYLIPNIQNGIYHLVAICGDSVLTKIAIVDGDSIIVDFHFPADDLHDIEEITEIHEQELLPEGKPTEEKSDIRGMVRFAAEGMPAITVNGLDKEALLHMLVGRRVDVTFFADLLERNRIPADAKAAIKAISGDLNLTYYDFHISKEIYRDDRLESTEYLKKTKTVLEIVVPYDSSMSVGTSVFRYHDGSALRFEELSQRPTSDYRDGTCYITTDRVFIYADRFSVYAVGSAFAGQKTRGKDTITYSAQAAVDLKAGRISMLYKREKDTVTNAIVSLYLVGENGNLLIAESGVIPPGSQLDTMYLRKDVPYLPSVGSYQGLMKITYLNGDISANTNVEIPLTIVITQ